MEIGKLEAEEGERVVASARNFAAAASAASAGLVG